MNFPLWQKLAKLLMPLYLLIYLETATEHLRCFYLMNDHYLQSKKSETLLKEIEIWVNESINYQPESNVFLVNSFDYDDGSYDFRYFKLEDVLQVGEEALLIGSDQESKRTFRSI